MTDSVCVWGGGEGSIETNLEITDGINRQEV